MLQLNKAKEIFNLYKNKYLNKRKSWTKYQKLSLKAFEMILIQSPRKCSGVNNPKCMINKEFHKDEQRE